MNKKYPLFLFLASILAFSGCNDAWDDHVKVSDNVSKQTISEYLESTGNYTKFVELMKSTGVYQQLDSSTIYTIWAPTDAAMETLNAEYIDTDEKKMAFVMNHISRGSYSSKLLTVTDSLYMLSGKRLFYQPDLSLIDGVTIATIDEEKVDNGFVQEVEAPIIPRLSIWEWILSGQPNNKFTTFLKSLDYLYFDAEHSGYLGTDDHGNPIYEDSVVLLRNEYLLKVADLASEDSSFTFLIPTDELFDAEFNKFQKYYRLDDKASNAVPTKRDSAYIKFMVARDMTLKGAFAQGEAPDTLMSYYDVKVPFVKASIANSYKASNGYAYIVGDCGVKPQHKILPVLMEGENSLYSTATTAGTPAVYYRQRVDASGGYDLIVDNHGTSGILTGAVFTGPMLSSIKYRVKIRAINDFSKSYRWPDAAVALKQWLGPVTVLRNAVTHDFTGLSITTNKLISTGGYGTCDVSYDVNDANSYYIAMTKTAYSPVENMLTDEIDLGYYDYRYAESAVFRLIPQAIKMSVVADYIRLVPVFE
jgi:uncharacterized surface protein with fasciclin (FAS1) repeats